MMHTLTVSHIPSMNSYIRHGSNSRHYKSHPVTMFERQVALGLPTTLEPTNSLHVIFVLKRNNRDVDNLPKVFIDCLERKYGFNDNRIERLLLEKRIDRNMAGERIMFEFLTEKEERL